MTSAVFYSFHFDRDFWRVQQVRQIGALEEQEILPAQRWEQVKRNGPAAVEAWIDKEMKNKAAVVVLVGAETASRPWVGYEIRKAWNERIPLVGIRIHGLRDDGQQTDQPGVNPFGQIFAGSKPLSSWITLHDPVGATSQLRYRDIADNLADWAAAAYKRT